MLLRKTFGFEVLECSSCHITMLAIVVITQRAVIDKILDHVGLSLSAQPTALRIQRATRSARRIDPQLDGGRRFRAR